VPTAEEFIAQPVQAEREQVHQVVMAAEPQPEYRPASPVAPAVSPAPRAPDPAEIERALRDSGLELVQTRSGATHGSLESEPKFVPAKRERRPPPPDLDEPLVQVETGREPPTPKI
jgi:ribonuclease E